ncbi:MAG: hypothetical protein R3Y56_07690 [Akkermansia sp.]
MSWCTLSGVDAAALFTEAEAALVENAAGVVAEAVADAAARAREAVAANAANALPADALSVPRALRQLVLAIARRDALLRFALPITDERQAAAVAAEEELADIRTTKRSFLSEAGTRTTEPATRPHVIASSVDATKTKLI